MEKGISEIVGRGELAHGESTQLYRALRVLLCATCGAEIAPGSLFTRRRVKGIGVRIMPQCPACQPFVMQVKRKEQSALLRSLLKDSETDVLPGEASPLKGRTKTIAEQVRSRLGPALKRGRGEGKKN